LKREPSQSDLKKGSLARELRLSEKLVAQLKLIFAKNPKRLFPSPGSTHLFLLRIRKTLAERHSDPNYHKIHPHTFRHYRATTEYHGSKDILGVQRMLGHKALNNTMRYTHLVEWPDAESFIVKEAKTTQEALELGKMGYEKYNSIGDVHLYRKRLSAYR
jgi:integrase